MFSIAQIMKRVLLPFFCYSICTLAAGQSNTAQLDTIKKQRLQEVVISASRVAENILKSPVSIEKVRERELRNSPQPSFFDALENVKGVHLIVPSMGFKVLNTRGFANTTNVRFAQLVDGVDNQAPHIGAPIANTLGPSDLDIQSVEILPGVASALYGMNAINGLANFQTKSPFEYQGASVRQNTGVNHVGQTGQSAHLFSETSFRYAQVLSEKWAYKINATYASGYDWVANDRTDLGATLNASTGLLGANNPAYDPVSGYGNESSNRRTVTLAGKSIVVARTGYYEQELANYQLKNFKASGAVHFRPAQNQELIYTYRFADLDGIYQRSNRFQTKDYLLQQHALSWKSPLLRVNAYWTNENTGQSYNLRSMGENIDRTFKNDNQWYADFTKRFNQANRSNSLPDALQMARIFADSTRPVPGTARFDSLVTKLGGINNWDIGAALRVRASLVHAEGIFDLGQALFPNLKKTAGVEWLLGFDHRSYIIVPDGNYFINPVESGSNLVYGKTGGFVQVTKTLLHERLKLGATLRADKADYFTTRYNPRFTAVYSPNDYQHLRLSYQSGYRFPSIFEGFSNINSGGVKRVGGLPVMSNGIFENSYLRKSVDDFQAAITVGVNKFGVPKRDSLIKANVGILKRSPYTYLRPEYIRSFEFGYKGLFFKNRLLLDVDFYYNRYRDFMAQVETTIPLRNNPDSLGYYMNDRSKQARYRLWTNSQTEVFNYGFGANVQYNFVNELSLRTNISYAKLDRKTTNDGLEDGFNTPRWIVNAAISHPNVWKNVGFSLGGKWQSSFSYLSFLVNGTVPSFTSIDGFLSYRIPDWKVNAKLGGTNLLNRYYYSILGGPQIGGFYYLTLTYGL